MSQMSALAKPSLGKAVIKAMCDAGSDAPGFRELDGTTYRVLEFDGQADIPSHLKNKFVGAIAEWANDSDEMTGLTVYRDLDTFGHDFALITLSSIKL